MTTREQFLQMLRRCARKRRLDFEVIEGEGKGSHYEGRMAGKLTIVQSGPIDRFHMKRCSRQLGIDHRDL